MNIESQLPRSTLNNNAMKMIKRLLALLIICGLTCPVAANAGVESLLYLAGGELRSVGFDGTSFTSGFTSLTTPIPEMVGISVIRTEEDVSTVAEPSTVLLFGGSLIGLFFANARRSRRAAIAA